MFHLKLANRRGRWRCGVRTLQSRAPVQVVATDLCYTYAQHRAPALDQVNLSIGAGEIALVLGKSGSGKTTLTRCINGLIPHVYADGTLSGEVRCGDEVVARSTMARLARKVGTVLQDTEKQIVASRVFNEIAFGMENLGMPRDEIIERVHEVARWLDIAHLLHRDTLTLSGGEQQRVVIAATLAMRPRVLLLDEPLAALDPPAARQALALFRRLADAGVTVLIVEHRAREVLRLRPHRVVRLEAGRVVFQGVPEAGIDSTLKNPAAGPVPPRDPHGEVLASLQHVTFAYAGSARPQLDDVSLEIRAGDVIALIGPNGAGKSTLCKHLIGLLRPQRGRVHVCGQDAADRTVAQLARQVGYVFQHPSTMLFAPSLREELCFGPRNIGLAPARVESNIANALETVGLAEVALEQSPFVFSFGQQKRIALASVLAMQPRILIMDEPTAGLDEHTAQEMMQRLLAAADRPEAIVMVTHDLDLAARFANRVVLLAGGRIVADAEPAQVLQPQVLEQGGLA